MKLFIKLLLFVFAVLIANVNVVSAGISFINIKQSTNSNLFHTQIAKTEFKFSENDLANYCQNELDLVDYRNRGISIVGNAAKTGMTDLQLLTKASQKAETAIGGTGRFAGTAKHTYAKNLLSRYQSIYGDRGLSLGSNYFKGPAGKGFLDVAIIKL